MPAPPIDHQRWIIQIPQHTEPLPEESAAPLLHYERSVNDYYNLVIYVDRNLRRVNIRQASADAHLRRLNGMTLLSLIGTFERFLKETAAACIDHVGPCVLDDRLNVFTVKGDALAAHFQYDSLGRSLAESQVWLNCDEINRRFQRLLADPFQVDRPQFSLFPRGDRHTTVSTLFQLRHSIVHNAGILTRSDATRLRLLTRRDVPGPVVLSPRQADVWYVKLFLDEVARDINAQVQSRLETLLTTLLQADPGLFSPPDKAREIAELFRLQSTIDGQVAMPPS